MKTITRVFSFTKRNLLFIILASQPFLDVISYIQRDLPTSYAGYIRLFITVFLPLYTLFLVKDKKPLILWFCVIGAFCALHVLNCIRVGYIDFYADIRYLLSVISAPIFLICFSFLFDKEEIKSQILSAITVNIAVIFLLFFISYFTKTGLVTYADTKVGWTGFAAIPNAQSLIIAAVLPFAVYLLLKYCGKFFPLPLLATCFIYFINATMAAYFSLLLVLAGYLLFLIFRFFIKKDLKFPVYNVIAFTLVISLVIAAYPYSPRYNVDVKEQTTKNYKENLIQSEIVNSDFDPFDDVVSPTEEIYLKNIDSALIERFGEIQVLNAYGENLNSSGITDMRLKKRIFASLVYNETDFLTKLFGFEYSNMEYNGKIFDLENDFPAIFYYYGYIGFGLYILLLVYFFLRIAKQLIFDFKESFNSFNFAIFLSFALCMGGALFSGYLLRKPNVSVYLAAVLLLILSRTEPLSKVIKRGKDD